MVTVDPRRTELADLGVLHLSPRPGTNAAIMLGLIHVTIRDGLTRVTAFLWVESNSQKGILVGAQGRMIKAIGTAARKELERELGGKVHLDLSVRVRKDWRGDERALDRLGIE